MDYKICLRNKPWLKVCNVNNICYRMLEATNQNTFIVFNLIQQNYELHTVEAYLLSGDSYNASLPQEILNDFIIKDYNANNFAHSLDDTISSKMEIEMFNEGWEKFRRPHVLEEQLKTIERVMGTRG